MGYSGEKSIVVEGFCMPKGKKGQGSKAAQSYNHQGEHPQRPDIGTERQFNKRKAPVMYRYDSSLAPELCWDEGGAREEAEALIAEILRAGSLEEAKAAAERLRAMSVPFLNWAGKGERREFEVLTLPLFVHERLSTRAIIATLQGHEVEKSEQLNLFSDPQWSITDQILRAYEYRDRWVNRMILGDSLVTMNSLLEYEGMGGKVQMIYVDPPYGVKFGSNFQPFVKKRDVKHNDDHDLTREPEMVQAYRDTWELGLHSYLSYLRDRFLLARELLAESGSIFVQISDENVHHVRELMDEVFGAENFVSLISFQKTGGLISTGLIRTLDYICWYSKSKNNSNIKQIYSERKAGDTSLERYDLVHLSDGSLRRLTKEEKVTGIVAEGGRRCRQVALESANPYFDFEFKGKVYKQRWKTNIKGLENLAKSDRLVVAGKKLNYLRYVNDFPVIPLTDYWESMQIGTELFYVVQTSNKVIERCLLMTTDPGDLVLDLTCGSGTTAYVAEQWGRRWITCDVSRVPIALARQRLLTATFPWYQLQDENLGPAGGFIYKRKQNKKGEEIGGIVPHITLKSIANNEPPDQEILVDRPETDNTIIRVCSPFTIEATIPPPIDPENPQQPQPETLHIDNNASYQDRMLQILRKSPHLHLPQNQTITLQNLRQPTRSQNLSAEATVKASQLTQPSLTEIVDEALEQNLNQLPLSQKPVALLFGPENSAITERAIFQAAQEAHAKQYAHLFVIGFAIAPTARQFVENCQDTMNIPATYIQATPDLLMGDLLKHMKSSQIFSVCGLPDIKIHTTPDQKYQVELLGLDVFDPTTMEVLPEPGNNVPAWFLDTNYNGLCFHVNQAFFPRTSAWDSIKKALKGTYDDEVWQHLAGTISTPFTPGDHGEIAVKVIDDRGNELLVTKKLKQP